MQEEILGTMSGAWANKNQTKALEIKMAREAREGRRGRKRDKKCSIQEASIAHALCTRFLLRHRFVRNGFLFTARALHSCRPLKCVGLFSVRSAAKSAPHKCGPTSSVFRANTPEKRPRIEWREIGPIEGWGEVARRLLPLFEMLMVLEAQKKIITGPRLDLRSEDNREI